ncbi:YfaZ family outer membrane protein [Falsiroseomonas bella]|uniref:YfaZ family outer membrane protein n=1 Tax=Falsiroseomonas bella TaxID=2184016 RepID=UPI001304D856|nr:YfaZ family outer membrane protein [Falsiroseomonas bella]
MGALAFLSTPAIAQAPAAAPDEWTFTLSPYVWFSGLGGEVTTAEGSESFSADFGDIFGTMKFSAMGLFEARRGNFSLVMDTLYLNLQQGVPVPGHGAFSGASARTQSAEVSAIGLYTVAEGQTGRFELGGGVRAWWFDTELTLDAGRLRGRSIDNSVSWVDPVISARGVLRLNDSLSITGYGDIGGFGVGSQLTYQVMATLDWQITRNISASVGYRWIHIDYDKGRSDISLDLAGPIIGVSLRF